jgi:Rrf2 family protein
MRFELTRRADYAIRAMVALARAGEGERLSVREIAAEQAIPVRFLPAIMGDLGRKGLVEARLGRNGGYLPGRPPSEISIRAVIEAIEGDGRRRRCVLHDRPCASTVHCAAHDVLVAAQDGMLATLEAASVQDIATPCRLGTDAPYARRIKGLI